MGDPADFLFTVGATYIVRHGADRALRTKSGKTAEDIASSLKNDAVVERLRLPS